MSAFSVPSAPVTDGGAVTFDLNYVQTGGDITHAAGSADIEIAAAGTYYVQYTAVVSPAGTTLPATNIVTFAVNGQAVSAGAGAAQFTSASPSRQITAATIIEVTAVPTTLQVISSGGTFIYSSATINVFKV